MVAGARLDGMGNLAEADLILHQQTDDGGSVLLCR
jgi:hypothetical protein